MKPGTKPKPSKVRELYGNRSRRPIPKDEIKIKPIKKPPPPPRFLGRVAKKAWRDMAKEMCTIGTLTKQFLEGLCSYAIAVELRDAAYDAMMKGENPQTNYGIVNKQGEIIRKWLSEIGGTPSSVSGVKGLGIDEKDPTGEDFFN